MGSVEQNIVNAIKNNRLSLQNEGEKFWFNYKIRITFLYWSRNNFEGYKIEVYSKQSEQHLETIMYGH